MGERGRRESVRGRAARVVVLSTVAALGLLLWARLKLVTETPRMVYADPPASAGVEGDSSPAPSAPARPADKAGDRGPR